jgi:hypothetical protein
MRPFFRIMVPVLIVALFTVCAGKSEAQSFRKKGKDGKTIAGEYGFRTIELGMTKAEIVKAINEDTVYFTSQEIYNNGKDSGKVEKKELERKRTGFLEEDVFQSGQVKHGDVILGSFSVDMGPGHIASVSFNFDEKGKLYWIQLVQIVPESDGTKEGAEEFNNNIKFYADVLKARYGDLYNKNAYSEKKNYQVLYSWNMNYIIRDVAVSKMPWGLSCMIVNIISEFELKEMIFKYDELNAIWKCK